MNSMKSVSTNSKNKSLPVPTRWWKVSVHYGSAVECNNMALATAVRLRDKYPGVYFARYCNANEGRADYYVSCFANVAPVRQSKQLAKVIEKFSLAHLRGMPRIDLPVAHEGSQAHATGFDCVVTLAKAFCLHPDDDSEAVAEFTKVKAALADVVHWMNNMLGIDYVDEARQSLYSIERILTVFEQCINAPVKELRKN